MRQEVPVSGRPKGWALAGAIAISVVSGCEPALFGDCADTITSEVASPDGRHVATVFERNCGATSDYSTNLSLREAEDAFDPDEQPPVLVVEGQVALAPAWSSKESLTVALFRYSRRSRNRTGGERSRSCTNDDGRRSSAASAWKHRPVAGGSCYSRDLDRAHVAAISDQARSERPETIRLSPKLRSVVDRVPGVRPGAGMLSRNSVRTYSACERPKRAAT